MSEGREHRFSERDVVWFHHLHLDLMKKPIKTADDGYAVYKVPGKLRPMLILQAVSKCWYYTLAFTGQRPSQSDWVDFFPKENGAPRTFGPKLGFTELSYLWIRPVENSHDKQAEDLQTQLPEPLFLHILKEINHRALRAVPESGIDTA